MVAIVSPNSTSKEQEQATLRVLTIYFTNYLGTKRLWQSEFLFLLVAKRC